jgi:HAD superfamily 5'-nucleotidase-like hydrolase
MSVFVNRTLNLKAIKAIGFDMDYTLVRYHTQAFEEMTYEVVKKRLIELKAYPQEIDKLRFRYDLVIRGLVLDKERGNILKLSTYSKVKRAFHGEEAMDFKIQKKIYKGLSVDLNESHRYSIVDTSFSLAHACLTMQLVTLKDQAVELPAYKTLEEDVLEMVDLAHRDGTLKGNVAQDVSRYILPDPISVRMLERLKSDDKKLWVITNSDYTYTKLLLDYAVTPYLERSQRWQDLFDVVITSASKPRFFTDQLPFLAIDEATGLLRNYRGSVAQGLYQGGCAHKLQQDTGFSGEEILYIGDHIYGDVLTLKKHCDWRTALVIEELEQECEVMKTQTSVAQTLEEKMQLKKLLEQRIDQWSDEQFKLSAKRPSLQDHPEFKDLLVLDQAIQELLKNYQSAFNPYWGQVMRAGLEPSRLAGQVEKYACVYMAKIADLGNYSTRTYFRPRRKILPHDLV